MPSCCVRVGSFFCEDTALPPRYTDFDPGYHHEFGRTGTGPFVRLGKKLSKNTVSMAKGPRIGYIPARD